MSYPILMKGDLDKFEEYFYMKRKLVETLSNIMNERAIIEETYSKGLEKIASQVQAIQEKGFLSGVLGSIKSYHVMKADQAKTYSNSIKEDVVLPLRNFIKQKIMDSKKMLTEGDRQDYQMKLVFEKLEATKKNLIMYDTELEDAQKTRSYLNSVQAKDTLTEERRKQINDRIQVVTKNYEDQEKKLKQFIAEYNDFRQEFTKDYNTISDFYKNFEELRLGLTRDVVLKSFVYELSYIRNIQYDIDKLISKCDGQEPDKGLNDIPLFQHRKEPNEMLFDDFINKFIMRAKEGRAKNGIIFDTPKKGSDDFGLSTAFKSLTGLFGSQKTPEAKKREAEINFLDKKWDAILKGKMLTQSEEQAFIELLQEDSHRKLFIELYIKYRIRPNYFTLEGEEKAKSIMLRLLHKFFNECDKSRDWGNIKRYVEYYRCQSKEIEPLYKEIESDVKSHNAFQSVEFWVDYLIENLEKNPSSKPELFGIVKHYIKDIEKISKIVKALGERQQLEQAQIENTKKEIDDSKSTDSANDNLKKQESFDRWVENMEDKISTIETKRKEDGDTPQGKIFTKKDGSNSKSLSSSARKIFEDSICSESKSDFDIEGTVSTRPNDKTTQQEDLFKKQEEIKDSEDK